MTRRATMRRSTPPPTGLIGVLIAAVLVVGVYLSYSANDGLPLVSRYDVTVELPDAQRLIKNNEARIAGVRVGQVADVDARADHAGGKSVAVVTLALDAGLDRLPQDTTVKVRPASILGATYVDLIPGRSSRTVPDGGRLALEAAEPTVELTDLLNVFTPAARRDLRAALVSLGDGLAGRGPALGTLLTDTSELLGPLSRVSRTLAATPTELDRLIVATATFMGAAAPEREAIRTGTTGAARTFTAFADERGALDATLRATPRAEAAVTSALTRLQPSLDGLAVLATDLRPAAQRLPRTTRAIARTLDAGLPALRRLPRFSTDLGGALARLGTLSRRPWTEGGLRKLRDVVTAATPTVRDLTRMQLSCNSIGIWAESFASTFGALGTGQGPAIANIGVTHLGASGELLQNPAPSSDVGVNYLPNQNESECESGNEPYEGRQLLNNPPGNQPTTTRPTSQDPAVRARAAAAGLLGPGEGGR